MRARARRQAHNAFLKALLSDDTEGMNEYMNEVSCELKDLRFGCMPRMR